MEKWTNHKIKKEKDKLIQRCRQARVALREKERAKERQEAGSR